MNGRVVLGLAALALGVAGAVSACGNDSGPNGPQASENQDAGAARATASEAWSVGKLARMHHVRDIQEGAGDVFHVTQDAARAGLLVAKNSDHGFVARLSELGLELEPESGTSWTLALSTRRFGCPGELVDLEPVMPTGDGNRMEYAREQLVEWYLNGPLGLEQGYEVPSAPCEDASELVFELTADGLVPARAQPNLVHFEDASGERQLSYSDLMASDADGKMLPTRLEVAGKHLKLRVQTDGARWPVTVDPSVWVYRQRLLASDAASSDAFGTAVSIGSSSSPHVLVGADQNDIGINFNQGAAYVFVLSGTSWTQQARLLASDGVAGDRFGYAVDTASYRSVVGAPFADVSGQADQGAAYVFGSGWTQYAKLVASDGAAGDNFGISVRQTSQTIYVGAHHKYVNASNQGAVYVYSTSGSQRFRATASDGAANDYFGRSFDVTTTPRTMMIIGAYGDDVGGNTNQGSAYVFHEVTDTSWTEYQKLVASDGAASDYFGYAVSMYSSYAVIGAYRDDIGSNTDQGSAYIFYRSGATWTQQAKLVASDGAASDYFGRAVAMQSPSEAAVGAYNDNSGTGAVYLFKRTGTTWAQTEKLTAWDASSTDYFGRALEASGDYLAVGAPSNTVSYSDQGAAYVYQYARQLGSYCSDDDQCESWHCADGVCCNTSCSASCQGCRSDLTGLSDGTCGTSIDGAYPTPYCDGHLCNGVSTSCPSTCATDADCSSSYYCNAFNDCVPKKARGATCDPTTDCSVSGCDVCATGHCVDGYCCFTACTGECRVCARSLGASADGTCTTLDFGEPGYPSCSPYVCTGASFSCPSSCSSDSRCVDGYYCASDSTCKPQKPQGSACNTTSDCDQSGCRVCATGQCVDGFCCDTTCTESCDVCSAALGATADGTCSTASAGYLGVPTCSPFACNGTDVTCPTACTSDIACPPGEYCAPDQTCKPQKPQGSQCNELAGGDCFESGCRVCETSYCVDGYCCESACSGLCEACSVAKTGAATNGTCAPVTAGKDFDDECAADAVSTCGLNGNCDGARGCALYSAGTVCQPRSCASGTTQNDPDTCDGSGTCTDGGTTDCSPFVCSGGSCVSGACTNDSQCASGYYCASGGTCLAKKLQGESCNATLDCNEPGCGVCATGFCVDGVCCDTACAGDCDTCLASEGATAEGTCTVLARGSTGQPSCSPYVCDGSSADCPTLCLQDGACATNYYCASDQNCKPRKAQGVLCNDAAGGDCLNADCRVCTTGNCVDGFCCDSPCNGACRACSNVKKGSGTNGTCGLIAGGSDPDDECTQDAVSSCGQNGTCDGTGACALYASGTVCEAQSCADGSTQANADTCDGAGSCVDGGTTNCDPYICSSSSCVSGGCASDNDCVTGYYCAFDGQCRLQKADATACDTTADCMVTGCAVCTSGNCVDGVCCDTACGGECDACAASAGATADGICTTLAAGATGSPTCAPYTCTGTSTACPSQCQTDTDCISGYYCAADQTCKPQKLQAAQCNDAPGGDCFEASCRVCATGYCVDGYCCETACAGTCESCDASTTGAPTNGLCRPIFDDTDPYGECATEDVSTCGQNGTCDGAGACALYASGTECAPRSCVDGTTQSNPDVCNGSGTCQDGGTTSCSPFVCTSGACVTGSCTTDAQCAAGYYCASGGICVAQKLQGSACDTAADCNEAGCNVCATGYCIDGVCCDSACGSSCDACSVAAGAVSDGSCTVLPSGELGSPSCAPYLCSGSSASCPGLCLTDDDCASGYFCASDQSCKPQKTQGVLCNDAAGGDCLESGCRVCTTGSCSDGFCCDAACDGACQACSNGKKGSGLNGVCGYIASGTDPDGECAASDVSTCGQNGSCDGAGACALFASGTVCQPQACQDGTTQSNPDTCDGAGTCVDGGTTSCSPFVCSSGSCVSGSCSTDTDCSTGYYCASDGQCRPQKALGATCDRAADCQEAGCALCASGYCSDGVCCDSACGGSCDACSIAAGAAADGTCTVLGSGATGDPSCAPYACSGSSADCPAQCLSDVDCAPTRYCASDQTCKPQKSQGVLCNAAAGADCLNPGCRVCNTGFCSDGFCCDRACDGACEACSATKTGTANNGVCGFVPGGQDPDDECASDSVSTCGQNGSCDGSGACELYASGTVCEPRVCADGTTQNDADTCDGAGTCVDGGTTTCSPFVCTGDACVGGSCSTDDDCTSGYYCGADGACHTQKTQGSTCDATADCQVSGCRVCDTGHCVDGVCCDTACGGACDACSASLGAGTDGTCTILSSGALGAPSCSPYACDGSNVSCPTLCVSDAGCASTHYCSGDQTCKPRKIQGSLCDASAGGDCFNTGCQVCVTGFCADGFCCDGACDGLCQACSSAAKGSGLNGECGTVADGTDPGGDCLPYTCSAGACATQCTTTDDCSGGRVCIGATQECVQPAAQGTECSYNQECQSGFCVDGVCCDTACTGQCEACDVSASPGTCAAVVGEPHGSRPACAGDAGQCGGQCDGNNRGACSYPASGTACGSPTCKSGEVSTFECDGQGQCVAQASEPCSPYVCDVDACKTSCASDADCTTGFGCADDGSCAPTGGAKCSEAGTQSISATGTRECSPYLCEKSSGNCYAVCQSSAECASGHVCESNSKTCVPASAGGGSTSEDEGGCGCRLPSGNGGAPDSAWLLLLGTGLLLRRRVRQRRC